ncbi:MAG: putative serine/threonine-protein kinase pknB [Planctomycetota bacterium]|nr:MAG: putative serine/threonine-protein kinase pknB [Planctomycetota bacterium]
MKTVKTETACEDIPLDVLLFGDEESDEFRQSASHVESCSHCQDRLIALAADDGDWDNVREVLQTTVELDDSGPRGPSSGRRVKLDFLSPPSHPEMLGRLGRYEIEQVIGFGGMGIVLKGFDTELNRPAAIKVLAPHLAHSGVARQRFAREARAAAAVVHEHVVAIHNVESEQETPFLVMQYVPGRSLQARVEQDGPLTATEILRIGMQAAAGLAAAHAQGVIHRDVKPANILLENGVERVLLTDFGLARAADDASLTHSGIIAGTPHYMSPEQASGEPTDGRSDLFSLGAVLYFMATGHPPFRAERAMAVLHRICHDQYRPVCEIAPHIPDELTDVIDRLLEKKPSRRFASAADAQQALAALLSDLQQPRRWRTRRWLRRLSRHRWPLLAAAGVLAAAGAVWPSGGFRIALTPIGHSGAASSTNAIPLRADTVALERLTDQPEFANELFAIDQSLMSLAGRSDPESSLVRAAHDSWTNELQAADAAVTRLERSWSVGPDDTSTSNSLKGENP